VDESLDLDGEHSGAGAAAAVDGEEQEQEPLGQKVRLVDPAPLRSRQ
jgi:hypothetical protein